MLGIQAFGWWAVFGVFAVVGAMLMIQKRYYFQFISLAFVAGLAFTYCYFC